MKRVLTRVLFPSLMVLVLILPLITILGCGDDDKDSATVAPTTSATETATQSPTAKLETYKIGAVFSSTGNNAPLGEPEKNVAEMLEKQINDAGGVNGHKLDIVLYDTKSDNTECAMLVKKLIDQDKVSAIVGPTSTGESLALLDTVKENQIPLVSCAANVKIVEPVAERYWVFKTPQSDRLAADAIFEYQKKQGITKVATICDASGYGKGGEDTLVAEAPKYGITIVTKESYGVSDTDMTTQLTKIKGTDAQAIICWGTNPGPAVIATNKKTLNIDLPLYNSHGIANAKFFELAGNAANGVLLPVGKILVLDGVPASDPQKPLLQQFLNDYQAAYGKTPDIFAGYAYDAIMMVVEAMKEVGPDKAQIRNYLENNLTGFVGATGTFNMSSQDHNGLGPDAFIMSQIVDGKWTAIQ